MNACQKIFFLYMTLSTYGDLPQTGMSKKVRTLVDLEALLNDGTAYVLFKLLQVISRNSVPLY